MSIRLNGVVNYGSVMMNLCVGGHRDVVWCENTGLCDATSAASAVE